MRFDWYAATVREDPSVLLDRLSLSLGAEPVQGIPRNGYTHGHYLKREGSTVATVFSGGRNGAPHVFASGDDTDRLVPALRKHWHGRHAVTRMDASEDFDGAGSWDRLYAMTLGLADERGLKIDQAGDWHRLEAGRTFYVGGRKSAVFCRLYEKGKQLRGLDMAGGLDISLDLVRLEVQVRPEGFARQTAASGSPEDAYGYADWTVELGRRVFGIDVERVHIRERRESDRDRAMQWAVRQYGAHLEDLADELGSWEAVGLYLHAEWVKQQKRRDAR